MLHRVYSLFKSITEGTKEIQNFLRSVRIVNKKQVFHIIEIHYSKFLKYLVELMRTFFPKVQMLAVWLDTNQENISEW